MDKIRKLLKKSNVLVLLNIHIKCNKDPKHIQL